MQNTIAQGRKRAEDAKKFGVQKFATDLLEVADTVDMALANVPEEQRSSPQLTAFVEGIEGCQRVLHKVFESHGITKSVPEKEEFDPNVHEALFQAPAPAGSEVSSGQIMQVIKPGYFLNDRVLRAAQVGVAQ
mmetsp:Transcript_70569/g.166412  ORF Transcript_70569/g.166412 Transcript_70569/m.166412 type:complete len:133 (+) Transcript_70569:340-738(+)